MTLHTRTADVPDGPPEGDASPRVGTTPPKRLGRARRAIGGAAKAAALAVVFAGATVGGLLAHLDMRAPRSFAVAQVNAILDGTFQGKIVVVRAGSLHLNRLAGVDAQVFDPEGHRVIDAHGVGGRIGTLKLIESVVRGDRILVPITEVTIERAEVVLEDNAAGEIGLQRAFESKTPDNGQPSRGVEVGIADVRLDHVWVHGHLAAVPVIDADVDAVRGSFATTPETTRIDVSHADILGRGIDGLNPHGTLVAHAAFPTDPNAPQVAHATYEGKVGDLPFRMEASLDGKKVDGVADVAESDPRAFAAIAPGTIHLGAPVSLHAEVHGTLPVLKPELTARIGGGTIEASGAVMLPEGQRTDLEVSAKVRTHDLDLHLLETSAPSSRLTTDVDVAGVSHPGGKIAGRFRIDNHLGSVAGQVIPTVSAEGDFTEASARGTAQIGEAGAPTTVTFDLHPKPGRTVPGEVAFTTDTTVPDLDRIQRVGPIGKGHAHVTTSGRVDLDDQRIDAKVTADAFEVGVQGVALGRLHLAGTVAGPLVNPSFDAQVSTAPMTFGAYGFVAVTLTAKGSPQRMDVGARLVGDDRSPTLTAHARVSTTGGLAVDDVGLEAERGDVKAVAHVGSLSVHGGDVEVRNVSIDGLGGSFAGSVRTGNGRLSVDAKATDLDLGKIALLAGRDEAAHGRVSVDASAVLTRTGAEGHIDAKIDDLSALDVNGGAIRVALVMHQKTLSGSVDVALDKVGSASLSTTDVTVDGSWTDPETWKRVTGSVGLNGNVELAPLFERLPASARPISYASGHVAFHGVASRTGHARDPDVEVALSTTDLRAVGKLDLVTKPDGSMSLGPTPWSMASIDVDLAAKVAGATGHTEVTTKLRDHTGALATAVASAVLPIDELLRDKTHAVARLETLPVSVDLTIPRRSLQAFPKELGQIPADGQFEMTGQLRGTVRAPKLSVDAKVSDLKPKNVATCGHTIDAETKAEYDGKKGTVSIDVSSDGHSALSAQVAGSFDLQRALDGQPLDWDASGTLALTHFPLDVVGAFVEEPIQGALDGQVVVDGLHHAASLHGHIDVTDLAFAKAKFPKGTIDATAKDGAFTASARFDQTDGYASVTATGGLKWAADIAPSVDLDRPVDIAIAAKNFRASVAKPIVEPVFSEIDGRVDANVKLHVLPGGTDGSADGEITLRDGVIDIPQIGERFHGIKGHVLMKPWGTIRLDGFVADAPTGTLTASAQAVLSGLSLKTASAKLTIKQGQSIPIAVEGVPMGRAYGEITAKAEMSPKANRLDIHVDVPMLRVDLPQSTGNSVQGLDPDSHVAIGYGSGLAFQPVALAAPVAPRPPSKLVVRADIKLGKEVEVKRDTTLDVMAQGETVIEVSDKTHLTGQIRLLRGKLELEGKMFKIDRGVISFVRDDPTNPMVLATAYWDAPGGIRVIADFSGFVSSGKLELHSEPALTQDEILALVLFGSADGSFGASAPPGQGESPGVQGVGLAGGVVTQGLNKVISGVTTADISTRIDTSEANNPRPEVGVQITKTISARLGYKLGVPAPGDNPDRAELTVDWRFIRNWSLSTQVGDQGSTALDVVWRKRY